MNEYRISVKDMVRFLYSSGDLSSKSPIRETQKEGQRIHAKRQATYGEDDRKEVFVETFFKHEENQFHVSGRIDGLLIRDGRTVIEEIKSTKTDLSLIDEKTYPAHMMQAKIYAYIHCLNENKDAIDIALTYIHTDTDDIKTITKHYPFFKLEKSFKEAVQAYTDWLDIISRHHAEKTKSLEGLKFPFDTHREGQYPFMGAVYQTLIKEDILYATAPTGIGKTVASIFAALKTIKTDKEKLFYLTAKNAGKSIAVETVERLKAEGLKIKALTLNSKDNMCLMEEVDCDPDICPYAKGFYNRLKGALEDIFVHDDVYALDLIKDYATYHTICPHEFALEISTYADIIICDYNYVFDPRIRLMRYFEDDYYVPKLLVDESHNLIDRSRSMYSASLSLNDLLELKKTVEDIKPPVTAAVDNVIGTMRSLATENEVEKARFHVESDLDATLLNRVTHLTGKLEGLLEIHKKHPKRKAIRDVYFLLLQFQRISDFFTEAFRFTIEAQKEGFTYNIVCLDASTPIKALIDHRASGTVFFSATLKPVNYFSALLTKKEGKAFEVPSPFNPSNLGLFIDISTSTKYHDRTHSVERIIDSIYALLETKKGNYIIFFPSYRYMEMVLEKFDREDYDTMVHTRGMSYAKRRRMLSDFKDKTETTKVLFSVLGGSFSEGVDYVGDMLSGVMVVGVALPAFNKMNELLKDYFYEQGYDGFHYAYTYPGMNKVIQAIGRVIRTTEDRGVAVLFDQRYQSPLYKSLFPKHWSHAEFVDDADHIQGFISNFWDKFGDE